MSEREDLGIPINWGYPRDKIPPWCRMAMHDHEDGVEGCWGISHGFVGEEGEDYCKTCEFHKAAEAMNV